MTENGDGDTRRPTSAFRSFLFPEAAALFNPALGAAIICSAAAGHLEDAGAGLPWLGAFLAMPFAVHQPTRDSLPRDIRTTLPAWVSQNPVIRDGFGRRAAALVPMTRDAMRFAIRKRLVALDSSRIVPLQDLRVPRPGEGRELRACLTAARLSGRWMARTDLVTAYNLLGVRV